ncbi:MAG: nucleoside kinase [Bacteroidales bacterium]|nr:nucleoside kinase [Bacteroidales bacterium]
MTKIESARQEYRDWSEAIGIDSLDRLREVLEEGKGIELINLCEARQERKYAEVANQIFWNRKKMPIVMMSGPSSSGKTSSSLRIAQQCRVLGMSPKVIELDNYFVDRTQTPRDEKGEYDFECLGAMDIELLNSQLNDLLDGKEVVIPKYDFVRGNKVFDESRKMKLEEKDVLFMEGIHALNPALTPAVDQNKIFRIYISALSALPGGEKVHNSTTDKRLLRRIVRDNRTRGTSPEANILRWPSVRKGENENIFPYEENARIVFNSSTLYDLPVLKYFAEPLLHEIAESSPAYEKAQQLLKFLENIKALTPAEIAVIPPTSIMREFIGGQKLV